MKKLSYILSAALLCVLIAAVGPTGASAAGVPPKVTVNLPANNSWAKTVPSFTFSITGTGLQKMCVLSGPDTFIDEESCSSPWRPVDILPDGTYTYTVSATNDEGSDSGSRSFKLDRTAPAVQVTSGVSEGAYGNATTASYKGTYSDANIDTVTCRLDSAAATNCGSGGEFQAQYNSFGEGDHTFLVVARDLAGNESGVARHFTIDRTAPTSSIKLVGGGTESSDNTPAFQISGSDTGGPVTKRCSIFNQISWTDCNADTWVATDGVADGFVEAWLEVSDRAGNKSFASYGFTLDSTIPTITYSGFANDKTTNATPSMEFWVDDVHEGSSRCAYDPAGWDALVECTEGAGHVPKSALTLGSHQFWISSTDTFGNAASAIYSFEVVAVTLPPVTPATGDPGNGGKGGQAGQALVNVKAKSSKVKKGKFTLALTITATGPDACQKTRIVIAPKVKKAKAVTLRPLAGKKGTACVASAKIKLAAKFKKKKATVTVTHGGASKRLTIKL